MLEKDPEERYQTARDIRTELRGLRKEIELRLSQVTRPGSVVSSPSSGATPRMAVRRKGLWIGAAAATVSATLLNLLGRPNQALALWEAVTIRDPVNVNALFNLGTSQINAGRLDEAMASYRTVLSLSPNNGVAHYQLGIAMLLSGDANGALVEFEQEAVEAFRMIGLPMAYHPTTSPPSTLFAARPTAPSSGSSRSAGTVARSPRSRSSLSSPTCTTSRAGSRSCARSGKRPTSSRRLPSQ
jgi:tetratricopeptide (TPR) repeat protein